MPAAAQAVVLERGPLVARHRVTTRLAERDRSRHPVGTVLRDVDRGLADLVREVLAGVDETLERGPERSRRAGADRPEELVHASAGGGDEGLPVDPERDREAVGAEARVRAGAAVVGDRDPLALVAVEMVGDALGIPGVAEAVLGVAATFPFDMPRVAPAR